MKKSTTLGIIVANPEGSKPLLLDTLLNNYEMILFEKALKEGSLNPLQDVYEFRTRQSAQDDEIGNYVERILSNPFLSPHLQEQGVRWLKSKIKLENFEKTEKKAAQVIAEYACKIFETDPHKTEFLLSSTTSQVLIRIFLLR